MGPGGSFVYFMRPIGADGPVKIGCSVAPDSRIKTYQAWSPVPLELVATIPGKWAIEWAFHARFAHLRTHHEWFRASPELTETIEAIRAGTFDLTSLPPPKRIKTEAQILAWRASRPRRAA